MSRTQRRHSKHQPLTNPQLSRAVTVLALLGTLALAYAARVYFAGHTVDAQTLSARTVPAFLREREAPPELAAEGVGASIEVRREVMKQRHAAQLARQAEASAWVSETHRQISLREVEVRRNPPPLPVVDGVDIVEVPEAVQ
jgi:hypothetical protein